MVKYIMLFVLVKPTNEEKKIIQAYSFSCWIVSDFVMIIVDL